MLDSLYCEWLEVAASNEFEGLCVVVLTVLSEKFAGLRVLKRTYIGG